MKPTVISQDTPRGEIPSLLLPAYGETPADGGHCDAVCRHAGRTGGGGVV